DIREQPVASNRVFDIATAIRPGAELLDDPRGEPGRRVGERKGKRLRLCPLYPLVTGLVSEPCRTLVEIRLLLGRGIGHILLIAADRQQVEVNADQFLGTREAEARGGKGAPGTALHRDA